MIIPYHRETICIQYEFRPQHIEMLISALLGSVFSSLVVSWCCSSNLVDILDYLPVQTEFKLPLPIIYTQMMWYVSIHSIQQQRHRTISSWWLQPI